MNILSSIPATLTTFETGTDDPCVEDEHTMLEVVDVYTHGFIQIKFKDRNEDCYLTFNLADLRIAVANFGKEVE